MSDFNTNFGTPTEMVRDDLIVGTGLNVVTKGDVTIASGQTLTRGAVLGLITTSGKYTLATTSANDGSQSPIAILANDVDASGGDVTDALIYTSGEFNQTKLNYGSGFNASNAYTLLKAKGIVLKSVMAA